MEVSRIMDFFLISSLASHYCHNINRSIDFCSEETSLAIWCTGMEPGIKRNVDKFKLVEEDGKDDEMP